MAGELTGQGLRQTIVSNPAMAEELGAFFAAERTVGYGPERDLGQFTVDGERNAVEYNQQNSGKVGERMAGQIDMRPGSIYSIEADGKIDKNGMWFGGDVGPQDRQDGRTGSRLQVAVTDQDGRVLERHNYRPGMRISSDVEGAKLGFVFADGDVSNNSGHFNVNVRERPVRSVQNNVSIVAADADGIDAAGRAILDGLDTAPSAGTIPSPDSRYSSAPAGRGIVTDGNVAETTDGYRLTLGDNTVDIDWPGRRNDGLAETRIRGGKVYEADGTEWPADEHGNYILPNGALFNLDYNDDGEIRKLTLVHGDSKVVADGIDDGDGEFGRVTGGGYEFRRNAIEDLDNATYRMGGLNDGYSEADILWNVEAGGTNLGIADGNRIHASPYLVDPELKPEFGTQDYERMLRSEIEDYRSIISGYAQDNGASTGYARQIADYVLGNNGAYQQYSNALKQSANSRTGGGNETQLMQQLMEQAWMQQMFGGMPQSHGSFPQAMQAIQMLYFMLQQQMGMQNETHAATNNLRSYIPSYQNQNGNIDPTSLVEQVLAGVGQRTNANRGRGRGRLDRFDLSGSRARRAHQNDPGAALLRNRLSHSNGENLANPREVVEQMDDALSRGVFDWAVTDGDARGVIDRMAGLSDAQLAEVAEHLGADQLNRLEDQLSDDDKGTYSDTINRLRTIRNLPQTTLRGAGETAESVVEDIKDPLSRGVFDWSVTDGDAREVIDRLSKYPTSDLKKVVNELGADFTTRLVDQLSDEDKTQYQGTIDRLVDARNDRRETMVSGSETVDELKDELSRGVFDWAVTDGNARSAVERLSKLNDDDLAEVAEHVGPELLTRLEDQLSDSDKETYGPTIDRLRMVRNEVRADLVDVDGTAEELDDLLSRGVFDWAVTDGNARDAMDKLARFNAEDIGKLVDKLGPDMTDRLLDQLNGSDSAAYEETIARLNEARNAPRQTLSNARAEKEKLEDLLTYGAFDWSVTDSNARNAIHLLSKYNQGDMRRLTRMIDPDYLNRIESNLTDADKKRYAPTLRRLQRARN